MKKRNKSIVQKEMDRCFICGTPYDLHTHEIFFGTANRQNSIDWGCYIRLCGWHHNMSDNSVHFNNKMRKDTQAFTQKKFEELYGHDKFMEIFHKSYIDDKADE